MEQVFCGLWPRGLRHGAKGVGQTSVGKSLALLRSLGSCASAHSLHALECPKEVWTARVSFFLFFLKKEPVVLSEVVEFGPGFSAETVKSMCLVWSAHDG